MNENLNLTLLILVFILGFGWSMLELFQINKKLKSKKIKDKKEVYKDLKSVGNENILIALLEIISNIFKKIF